MKRTILAYVLAPLFASVGATFLALLPNSGEENNILEGIAIISIYSYIPSFLFGIPTHLVLRKIKKESLFSYVSVAALIGLAWGFIPLIQYSLTWQNVFAASSIPLLTIPVAAAFYLIKSSNKLMNEKAIRHN